MSNNQGTFPKEGDLYKRIEAFGKCFTLYYGYYEECDRIHPFCDPIPIYPDFMREPLCTEDGVPFVTMMQDACIHYRGDAKRTEDSTCAECSFFLEGEDRIGICQRERPLKNR